MATKDQKSSIPDDPVELMDLGMKIYARHCLMGEKSPLLNLESNTWEENGPKVENAMRLHELIEEETLLQEYFYRRDELILNIIASIQASHDLLSDIYHENPTKLGYWGFKVDNL